VSIVSQNTEKYGTVKISVADPYPGSGMCKKSGSVMNKPVSYIRELRKKIFGLKYLNSLTRIRNTGWKKLESGMEKIQILDPGKNIPDTQHWHIYQSKTGPEAWNPQPKSRYRSDPHHLIW
jgi:hypothetical protein